MGTRMDGSAALWVEEDRVIEGGLGIPANLKCHMHTMVRAQKHSVGSLERAALVPFYSQHHNRATPRDSLLATRQAGEARGSSTQET